MDRFEALGQQGFSVTTPQPRMTANGYRLETARLALERSRNPQVRAFAETMVRDHEAVNQQALALLQRLVRPFVLRRTKAQVPSAP
mgnify:CR=1 FL=1